MANHFLYELKARLEHAVKIEEPLMFKAEVESILRDLQIEVDPYGTPGDEDPNVGPGEPWVKPGEVWEEPSKSQEAEGIKRKRIYP